MQEAATVQYGDTFLVVGGFVPGAGQLSTILQYNPATEGWIELPGRLSTARDTVTAMLVEPESFPGCE